MIGSRIPALVGLGAGRGVLDGPGCRHDWLAFQAHIVTYVQGCKLTWSHDASWGVLCHVWQRVDSHLSLAQLGQAQPE